MKRKILIAAGVVAAMLASAGVAVAATAATSRPVTARACVTNGGELRLATKTGACASGQKTKPPN